MATIEKTELEGVLIITPKRFGDGRGYFSETYNKKVFEAYGLDINFVQDNQSLSKEPGTVRGLHYQAPPFAQSKLVRVLSGSIIDVAVDARSTSPQYGAHVSVFLSAENSKQLLVPRGFLHGFITLEPDTIVAYKVDNFYDAASDGAVLWSDPDLKIDWGVGASSPVVSEKDAGAPRWANFKSPF